MFRKLAHLQEQIGKERFAVLIDSGNTREVKKFCDQLINSFPLEIAIGNRTYEILNFLREEEKLIIDPEMVKRSIKMNANLREEDGQYLLDHQQEIPVILRGKVKFIFPNRLSSNDYENTFYITWFDCKWIKRFPWPASNWDDSGRFLFRKK